MKSFNILFIADIIGDNGYDIAASCLPRLIQEESLHFLIANGENAASGKGITPKKTEDLFSLGVDVITSGNHIWNKRKIYPVLDSEERILRPLNYPPGCPGHGSVVKATRENIDVGVINIQGRSFMYPIDCPFRAAETAVKKMGRQGVRIIVIDFHAEATAEKIAMGWHLDGKASAVIGTHTHVQTADERILPEGTAYITDAGMTGPMDSVIGMDTSTAVKRFMTQLPLYYKVGEGNPVFHGVICRMDRETGRAVSIERIRIGPHYRRY